MAELRHDIIFDPALLDILFPADDCRINPAISSATDECVFSGGVVGPCKTLQKNVQTCPTDGCAEPGLRRLRANLVSFTNDNPIPDGMLYTCRFALAPGVMGKALLRNRNFLALSPEGDGVQAGGSDVDVTIVAPPTATPVPSNCCVDRSDEAEAGCEDSLCQQCVCEEADDQFCCVSVWDIQCVDTARTVCASACMCP